MSQSEHTAPGQAAGYLFQPERALYWLARSERGGIVGVETEDDVVAAHANGKTIYEQDKSTVVPGKNPLSDKSADLWKTLGIWAEAISSGEIQLSRAQFVIATTAVLPDCLAKRIGKENKSDDDVAQCLTRLRSTGQSCSGAISAFASRVLALSDTTLAALLRRISLIDGSEGSCGPALKDTLLSALHIPPHLPGDSIIQSLSGWLCETLLNSWRNNKPGWITHEQFVRQRHAIVQLCERKAFRERAKELLPVTDEDRKSHHARQFVKQLLLVLSDNDGDLLIEAIDDFVRCANERTRLTQQGNITREDFLSFEGRLRDRWTIIAKRLWPKLAASLDEQELSAAGLQVLLDTLDHRESLAGHPTEEFYLTRGSYHRLADVLQLGWHPHYKDKLENRSG